MRTHPPPPMRKDRVGLLELSHVTKRMLARRRGFGMLRIPSVSAFLHQPGTGRGRQPPHRAHAAGEGQTRANSFMISVPSSLLTLFGGVVFTVSSIVSVIIVDVPQSLSGTGCEIFFEITCISKPPHIRNLVSLPRCMTEPKHMKCARACKNNVRVVCLPFSLLSPSRRPATFRSVRSLTCSRLGNWVVAKYFSIESNWNQFGWIPALYIQ